MFNYWLLNSDPAMVLQVDASVTFTLVISEGITDSSIYVTSHVLSPFMFGACTVLVIFNIFWNKKTADLIRLLRVRETKWTRWALGVLYALVLLIMFSNVCWFVTQVKDQGLGGTFVELHHWPNKIHWLVTPQLKKRPWQNAQKAPEKFNDQNV